MGCSGGVVRCLWRCLKVDQVLIAVNALYPGQAVGMAQQSKAVVLS